MALTDVTSIGRQADTIFSGLGTDEMLAVDTYKIEGSNTQNTVTDAAKEYAYSAAEAIRKRPGILTEVVTIATKGGGNMTKAEMTSRLIGVLGSAGGGALSKLSQSVIGGAFNTLGLSKDTQAQILLGVGQTTKLLASGADLSSAQGIVGALGSIAGNSDLVKAFDLTAEAALFGSILQEATRMGATEAFDILKDFASDKSVWENAYVASSGQALISSDLDTLDKIISETSADKVLAENPDAVAMMIANFRFKEADVPSTYPTLLSKLKAVLGKLSANWYQYNRAGKWVINYAVFAKASDDAVTLFNIDRVLRDAVITGRMYPPAAVMTISKALYPNAPLGVNLT
jgi:hypothetical protein